VGIRESRTALRLTQREASDRAGVGQATWSRIERGACANVPLETLAICAAAVDAQLAGFIEAPRLAAAHDVEHLRRQELVIGLARPGGWDAAPEDRVDRGEVRSRSIDVHLSRRTGREHIVVEVEDFVVDLGAVLRNLTDKTIAVRRVATSGPVVRGLLVLRYTARTRSTVAAFPELIERRFPASSAAWRGDRLFAVRRLRRGSESSG
jgi:transcriptional regulator with XRE-family HTH domain